MKYLENAPKLPSSASSKIDPTPYVSHFTSPHERIKSSVNTTITSLEFNVSSCTQWGDCTAVSEHIKEMHTQYTRI